MRVRTLGFCVLGGALALLLPLAAAIVFGGPATPAPMASINDPFKDVDFSALPDLRTYRGADGANLHYREYPATGATMRGSAVLVHGSSADSRSMHPMAQALAANGTHVFALDVRGHGASGVKGRIDHVGQLESDLREFILAARPAAPSTLVGFSSGGGFVLRIAGSRDQGAFQSYLLLSPYLGVDAPSQRPNSGGWVSVGVPRFIGLAALNAVGVRLLNGLPVTRFALSESARATLTPEYGYDLALNFAPHRDFMADIRSADARVSVLAGTRDEAFRTEKLEAIVRSGGKPWPVTLLPGIGHIPLTLDASALAAVVEQVKYLQRGVP